MFHLLTPAAKSAVENKVRADARLEICRKCKDSKTNTVLEKPVITCNWCGCIMNAKTLLPGSTCAHPETPLW